MKFERDELIGIFISIGVAVLFFAGLRFDVVSLFSPKEAPVSDTSDVVMLEDTKDVSGTFRALRDAMTHGGQITKLIVEDTEVGEGAEVKDGSKVSVHYIGMLQDGTQFDNSLTRGEPYSFVVGAGSVIPGWDKGLLGMKEGGERILVIPANLAYGDREVGPIPKNSTLLFSIQLVSVE